MFNASNMNEKLKLIHFILQLQGLKIAGIIHNVAHNSIKDFTIVQTIKLFSLQISQQVMQYINIYGMLRFEGSNVPRVS